MSEFTAFVVGALYTHEEVYRLLEVGNAGGIRPCLNRDGSVRRVVLMTSEANQRALRENPYHDRVEGDTLVYTATGREGQQQLAGINRRLHDQAILSYPIYGFTNTGSRRDKALGPRRWRFLGLLQFLRGYAEIQPDARAEQREARVFELFIHREPTQVLLAHEAELARQVAAATPDAAGASEQEVLTSNTEPAAVYLAPAERENIEVIRRRLLGLDPERFEHIVKEALVATGFEQATVTRYSNDGGIDVNAVAGSQLWPYHQGLVQVQAKRWLHTVGRREVAELRGSLHLHAQGVVVTTSFFTRAAVIEAQEPTKKPIVLVNGIEFATVLAKLGHKANEFH